MRIQPTKLGFFFNESRERNYITRFVTGLNSETTIIIVSKRA